MNNKLGNNKLGNNEIGSGKAVEKKPASLMLSCADQVGVIAIVANFFAERGIGLTALSEHIYDDVLFLRVEWELNDHWEGQNSFRGDFASTAANLSATFDVKFFDRRHSIGLFAAGETDVLIKILNKVNSHVFSGLDVAFIIASDERLSKLADRYGLPFFLVEQSDGALDSDRRLLDIVQRYKCDFLGLVQFPFRLPAELLERSACPIINTAPSLLLSSGALDPYPLAYQRGAKLLGASSLVLSPQSLSQGSECFELGRLHNDELPTTLWPIVHQATAPVKNGWSISDLRKQGAELEHAVFSSTLRALLEHRVLQYGCKAVVFD